MIYNLHFDNNPQSHPRFSELPHNKHTQTQEQEALINSSTIMASITKFTATALMLCTLVFASPAVLPKADEYKSGDWYVSTTQRISTRY
jgi:hypothetical protein